jgi:hypothetical protein
MTGRIKRHVVRLPSKYLPFAVLVERDALHRVFLTQACAGRMVQAPIQRHNRLKSLLKTRKSPLCWTILYGFTSSARQKCTVLHHKRTVSHRNRTLPQRVSRSDSDGLASARLLQPHCRKGLSVHGDCVRDPR